MRSGKGGGAFSFVKLKVSVTQFTADGTAERYDGALAASVFLAEAGEKIML